MRFGSSGYGVFLRGYPENDNFIVIGRNGSTLVQPGPNMKLGSLFPSTGQGTVVKDADYGDSNNVIDFNIFIPEGGDYAVLGHGYDWAAAHVNGGNIITHDSRQVLYGMESTMQNYSRIGYSYEEGAVWLVPKDADTWRPRVKGDGGKPIGNVFAINENWTREISAGASVRIEVYVVLCAKALRNSPPLTLFDWPEDCLDQCVKSIQIPYVTPSYAVNTIGLLKGLSQHENLGNRRINALQLWSGSSTAQLTSGTVLGAPFILLQNVNGKICNGNVVSTSLKINVETTIVLTPS